MVKEEAVKEAVKKIGGGIAVGTAVKTGTKVLGKVIGRSGIILGKTLGYVGYAYSIFVFGKTLNSLNKNAPQNKEISVLEEELDKIGGAISCLGREPYVPGHIFSIEAGGAINSLGKRQLLSMPNTRHPSPFSPPSMMFLLPYEDDSQNKNKVNSQIKENLESKIKSKKYKLNDLVPPEPGYAKNLINRAVEDYAVNIEDKLGIESFEKKKQGIITDLKNINKKLKTKYNPKKDYTPIQEAISDVVRELVNIESMYLKRVAELKDAKRKEMYKNVGKAAAAAVVGKAAHSKIK